MEKLKTLNNSAARFIILSALHVDHRFCAYSLYNHYLSCTFSHDIFKSLADYVKTFLGDSFTLMFTDESIDFCVRDLVKRYYDGFFD